MDNVPCSYSTHDAPSICSAGAQSKGEAEIAPRPNDTAKILPCLLLIHYKFINQVKLGCFNSWRGRKFNGDANGRKDEHTNSTLTRGATTAAAAAASRTPLSCISPFYLLSTMRRIY
jgi:hypothetical protein